MITKSVTLLIEWIRGRRSDSIFTMVIGRSIARTVCKLSDIIIQRVRSLMVRDCDGCCLHSRRVRAEQTSHQISEAVSGCARRNASSVWKQTKRALSRAVGELRRAMRAACRLDRDPHLAGWTIFCVRRRVSRPFHFVQRAHDKKNAKRNDEEIND